MAVLLQEGLPGDITRLDDDEVDALITESRERLRDRIVILGHHYQGGQVVKFADYTGDSYKLARHAAAHPEKEFIIFCGVHFMAESADILSAPHQKVILPNLEAGCSMADMATYDQVLTAMEDIEGLGCRVLPITYVNSTASIKALVGKAGGACCTSSNADKILAWAYTQADKVLFIPDEHLGRNTGWNMGMRGDDFALWDPFEEMGGLTPDQIRRARIILWKGFCSVHARFSVEQIKLARELYPDVRVIVHPECRREVVAMADDSGSTEKIVNVVTESPPGSVWAIGTEVNLVGRLAEQIPDKTIFCLDPITCPCSTMYRVHPKYLLWVLQGLEQGIIRNQITVPPDIAQPAALALDRMMEVTERP